jgi:hypothetical protein
MTCGNRHLSLFPPPLASIVAMMVAILAGADSGTAVPAAQARDAAPAPAGLTTDPQPPLGLDLTLTSLQKNASGGVASLVLTVRATVGIEGAVVTAKAPGKLVFADGTAVRTWAVDLTAPGAMRSIPVDLIVPDDGRYVVSAEVTGTARGNSIHRGAAYRLLVGVEEPKGKVRHGAIEYPAAEAAEPAP